MIKRYTSPEMGAIWTDQRRYETWLQVELAAAEAMAEADIIPSEAARDLRARGRYPCSGQPGAGPAGVASMTTVDRTTRDFPHAPAMFSRAGMHFGALFSHA